jgi:four helix bundle protein
MNKTELKERTKSFALRIMKLVRALPKDVPGQMVAQQLVRSGTSVAANYRSACRARSRAEFASKLGVVLEECDETAFWLELIVEDGMLPEDRVKLLHSECDELCAIIYSAISSSRTAAPPKC